MFPLLGLALAFPPSSPAADASAWWPSPEWGAGDQAGGSNWITPEKIRAAAALVKTGQVYELGHVYASDMPVNGQRSYKLVIPSFPTHGPVNVPGKEIYFNDEYVTGEIGQVGTQFDGPGHVGMAISAASGEKEIRFYNGFTADDLRNPYGLQKLGVENVKPIFTRGVLIDVAGALGRDTLPEGYEVSLAQVRAALAKEGIAEDSLLPGDALLFNFGWWRRWPDPLVANGRTPFVSDEVVAWIVAKQPSMVGSDTNLDGPKFTVHTEATMKHGIFNLELMTFERIAEDKVYQFLFVFTPLRLKGATGSPGRPIAIR